MYNINIFHIHKILLDMTIGIWKNGNSSEMHLQGTFPILSSVWQIQSKIYKLSRAKRAKRRLHVMINLSPSAKLSSSRHVRTYCISCNEFAASVGKGLPMFMSSLNNFSCANLCCPFEREVLSLGGWWKAFKPSCFEHQTACLKICSQSEKRRARS